VLGLILEQRQTKKEVRPAKTLIILVTKHSRCSPQQTKRIATTRQRTLRYISAPLPPPTWYFTTRVKHIVALHSRP